MVVCCCLVLWVGVGGRRGSYTTPLVTLPQRNSEFLASSVLLLTFPPFGPWHSHLLAFIEGSTYASYRIGPCRPFHSSRACDLNHAALDGLCCRPCAVHKWWLRVTVSGMLLVHAALVLQALCSAQVVFLGHKLPTCQACYSVTQAPAR
jgi:hypothetical protein